MTSDSTDTSVVVIGGGQAGLSVSYYLKRLGLDPGNEFVVLDRGPGTGGAWQHRWDALRIGSAHRINDLPGMDALGLSFETADRTLPAKDVVADYYEQYERFYGFQVVRSAAVSRVDNAGDRMIVTFSDGEGEQTVSTDVVINATGTWGSPFIPWYPGRDSFAGRHVHTAEYVDAADYAGKRVVVVGGGTSAIGFLLELEPHAAETTWVSRRPIEFLEDGELNLEARASAVAMQDEAARAGKALPSIVSGTGVPRTRRIQAGIDRGVLTARPMFSSIEPDGIRWSNGAFQEADVIIWSTGFRPELRHLAPLKLREKEGGIIVANGTSWKEPRIFFAGYGPQASTIGANRAGRTVARQAIATLSRLKRQEREAEEERRAAESGGAHASFSFGLGTPLADPLSDAGQTETAVAATSTEQAPVGESSPEQTADAAAPLADLVAIAVQEPDDSSEDIDLSWMMPSDEPIEPLDHVEWRRDDTDDTDDTRGDVSAPSSAADEPAGAEPAADEPAGDQAPGDPAAPDEHAAESLSPDREGDLFEVEALAGIEASAGRRSDAPPVVVEFEPAPDAESDTRLDAEPEAEPDAEPEAEPDRPAVGVRFAAAAVALAAVAPEAQPDSQPEPEAAPVPETETAPEPEPVPEPDVVPAPAVEARNPWAEPVATGYPAPAVEPEAVPAPEVAAEIAAAADPAEHTPFSDVDTPTQAFSFTWLEEPAAEPAAEQPAAEPDTAEPDTAEPDAAEPDAAEAAPAEPGYRFDVEPDDDDVDEGDRFRPRGTRPVTSDFPDFDQLLNPRSDD